MRLDSEQKKIICVAGVAVAAFLFVWHLLYIPKKNKVMKLKAKVDVGKAEIDSVYEMIGREVALQEGVAILNEKAEYLSKKRIRQKDISMALKVLSETANRSGVRIISTKYQPAELFTNKDGESASYDKFPCMKTAVAITLEGGYGQIAQYIYLLENSPIGLYTIEGFSIRQDSKRAQLRAEIVVWIYCFG